MKNNPIGRIIAAILISSALAFAAYIAVSDFLTDYTLGRFCRTEDKEILSKIIKHDYKVDLDNKISSLLLATGNPLLNDEQDTVIKDIIEKQKQSFTLEDKIAFSRLLSSPITYELDEEQQATLKNVMDNSVMSPSSDFDNSSLSYILQSNNDYSDVSRARPENIKLMRSLLEAIERNPNEAAISQAQKDILVKAISEAESNSSDKEDIEKFTQVLLNLKELNIFEEAQELLINETIENIANGVPLTNVQIGFLESISETSNKINIDGALINEIENILKVNKDKNILNDSEVHIFEKVLEQRNYITVSQKSSLLKAFSEQSGQKIITNKDLTAFLTSLYEEKPDKPPAGVRKTLDSLLKASNSPLQKEESDYLKNLRNILQKINIINICILVMLASLLSYLCYKYADANIEKKDLNTLIGDVPELNGLIQYDRTEFLRPFDIVEHHDEEQGCGESELPKVASAVETLLFDEKALQYGFSLTMNEAFILRYDDGGETKIFEAKSFPIWIGKGEECDIILKADKFVDNKHAVIFIKDSSYYFSDLNSMAGSRIDGKAVKGIVQIKNKTILEVSDTELTLMISN